jgi:hypothetical protein
MKFKEVHFGESGGIVKDRGVKRKEERQGLK